MESFDDLGLAPELVEALASEGVEAPTPFQASAIPVIRRGNNLLGRVGPGAGTLIAYGAAWLDRFEPGAGAPRALVIAPTTESARGLAESLATIALATGHSVAAANGPWAAPERSDVLFGTASEILSWARGGRSPLEQVEALVVEQASTIDLVAGPEALEALLEFLPKEGQRVVLSLPVTQTVEDFVARHVPRCVQLPAGGADGAAKTVPDRGQVRYQVVEGTREATLLRLVAELLDEASHACLFFATEDRAADVGDLLQLHGFDAGAPGDEESPVWLAVNELEARPALEDGNAIPVSYDAPAGADALDRRHGGGRGGVVLIQPREIPHLLDVARRTGYKAAPHSPTDEDAGDDLRTLVARLEDGCDDVDVLPWLVALEPLFARRGAARVAAAAVALLRERERAVPTRGKTAQRTPPTASERTGTETSSAPIAFVRLYVSLGSRDGAGPRDVVGAITGEAGVGGGQVGRIDVRENFSIVEVQEPIAAKVIRALNGVTIRGRSVRADYDRGKSTRPPRGRRPGPRPGGKPAPPGDTG